MEGEKIPYERVMEAWNEDNEEIVPLWTSTGPYHLFSYGVRLSNVYAFSPYLQENTSRLHFEDQLVNVV